MTRQDDNTRLGRYGEDLAVERLREAGLEVLARNWRCRDGEIDVVARELAQGHDRIDRALVADARHRAVALDRVDPHAGPTRHDALLPRRHVP